MQLLIINYISNKNVDFIVLSIKKTSHIKNLLFYKKKDKLHCGFNKHIRNTSYFN